jgi:predicted RecB family endonuclease
MDITFHFPPDLMNLLIEAIPALCKSKRDVLVFFQGAGVGTQFIGDLAQKVATSRDDVRKHDMVRTVLVRINARGESTLRERREVLRRVIEFEDFSVCWENDRNKAKALVADIRRLVNMKDTFTRIQQEQDALRKKQHSDKYEQEAKLKRQREQDLEEIQSALFSLFGMADPWARGTALEGVLNRLFKAHGILVREAFRIRGEKGQGIIEQIDGVVELDGEVYLVEAKWWDQRVGPGDVSQHLVRVFSRGQSRGIYIAYPGYTPAALASCKEALQQAVFVLCELEEFVQLLEAKKDLKEFLKAKVRAAIVDKVPLLRPLTHGV